MPYFRLVVKQDAPAFLLQTSPHQGPVLVEASDETTARVIAKTNFWTIQHDSDGYPCLTCLWMDRDWVMCEPVPDFAPPDRLPDCTGITCPDFKFDSGRFARMVEWPKGPGGH